QVLPGFVVAPLFFQGKIELGVVSQSYGAFNHILSDLSLIVNQFEALSQFSAGVDRLGEFLERMRPEASVASAPSRDTKGEGKGEGEERRKIGLLSLTSEAAEIASARGAGAAASAAMAAVDAGASTGTRAEASSATETGRSLTAKGGEGVGMAGAGVGRVEREGGIAVKVEEGGMLSLEGVTVSTPTGSRVLVQDLTFSLQEGEYLLIMGESGTGKSSLLRAMAGLWATGEKEFGKEIFG
ncbi:unnamed protein product, partial [Discosporangium mesarthrocarpum]